MEIINICPNCCNAELEDGVCPKCSYVRPESDEITHTLPVGAVLADRYYIGRVLGEGGFGITYMGHDSHVNLRVAIKEYYPTAFASRTPGTHSIYAYSGDKEKFFAKGLDRFLKEARNIAKFAGEPAVVNVSDSFLANGTAYIVMEYVDGDSLKTVLKQTGRISEDSAIKLLKPIIKTLAKMHKDGIIHRDISPDNIMVERNGKARLIDFGSATEQDGGSDSTVVMVKHGFAPIEQYDPDRSRQGTWTDVYSICATFYNIIEGEVPVDAQSRQNLKKPLKEFTAPISAAAKRAILHGLEILPEKRTQTMDALLTELPRTVAKKPKRNVITRITEGIKRHTKLTAGIAAAVVLLTVGGIVIATVVNSPAVETGSYWAAANAGTETAGADAAADSDSGSYWGASENSGAGANSGADSGADSGANSGAGVGANSGAGTVDSSEMAVYPPAKSYTYTPPSYDGFTLYERVDYQEGGRIIASSHTVDNKYAGFVIDYIPDSFLSIVYTQENSTFYSGIHPMAEITLSGQDYGKTYIGRSLNGSWYGDGYVFWQYNDPKCAWRTYTYKSAASEPDGTSYYFDGTNMFIQNYSSGKINSKAELVKTDNRWSLTENGDLYFVNNDEYSGFVKDGADDYFGFAKADGWSYRGQYIDGAKEGLGVYVWDAGDVFIGHYEQDTPTYGYYYEAATKKSYFVKYVDGALTVIEEIVGIDVDFDKILG